MDVDLSGDLRVRGEHGNYKVDGIEATGRKLRYFGSSLGRGIRVRVQFADEGHVEGGSALAWLF